MSSRDARRHKSDTIPKLDDVGYLFDGLGCVRDGLTLDAIRLELINLHLESRNEGRRSLPNTFWSNVRDVLRELMRLGMVARESLPSRPEQLDAHRRRTYTLTEAGRQFLTLEERDVWEFRYRFAQAMLVAHPYMRELHQLLSSKELFFPRVQRTEIPGDVDSWRAGPPEPLNQLASWVAESVRDVLRIEVSTTDLERSIRPYLMAAWKRLELDQKAHVFTKAVTKAVNDVIIRVLLHVYGMRMDYVTFRSAVGLLSDLDVIWHTRSLSGRRGWTLWATSDVEMPGMESFESAAIEALSGSVWLSPHKVEEETIKNKLIEAFFSLPDRRGGFALIHVLRAHVCHELLLHGRMFDAVLAKLHAQTLRDANYSVNLDRGGGDELPPSEEPFRIGKRSFYLITLLKRQ
jgi:hypothetical protein